MALSTQGLLLSCSSGQWEKHPWGLLIPELSGVTLSMTFFLPGLQFPPHLNETRPDGSIFQATNCGLPLTPCFLTLVPCTAANPLSSTFRKEPESNLPHHCPWPFLGPDPSSCSPSYFTSSEEASLLSPSAPARAGHVTPLFKALLGQSLYSGLQEPCFLDLCCSHTGLFVSQACVCLRAFACAVVLWVAFAQTATWLVPQPSSDL